MVVIFARSYDKSFRGAKLAPDVVAQALIQGLERNVYDIRVGQVNALYLASRLSPVLAQRILDNVASNHSKQFAEIEGHEET